MTRGQRFAQPLQSPPGLYCHRAIQLCDELDDKYHVAEVLIRLGETYTAAGEGAQARSVWNQALAILQKIGHPNADQLTARIQQLEKAPNRLPIA